MRKLRHKQVTVRGGVGEKEEARKREIERIEFKLTARNKFFI